MSLIFHITVASLLTRGAALGLAYRVSIGCLARNSDKLLAAACGLLLSIAMTHLIPEAFEAPGVDPHALGLTMLVTLLFFFVLERLLSISGAHSHAHVNGCCDHEGATPSVRAIPMLSGAALHNVVDGVLVASSFLIDVQTGWLVALAVLVHEVPQQIGYLVILKNAGYSERQSLFWCSLVALIAVLGAILGYVAVSQVSSLIPYALAMSGASFLFIVLHGLLPELMQHKGCLKSVPMQLFFVLLGVAFSVLVLGPAHEHEHEHADAEHMHSAMEITMPASGATGIVEQ